MMERLVEALLSLIAWLPQCVADNGLEDCRTAVAWWLRLLASWLLAQ